MFAVILGVVVKRTDVDVVCAHKVVKKAQVRGATNGVGKLTAKAPRTHAKVNGTYLFAVFKFADSFVKEYALRIYMSSCLTSVSDDVIAIHNFRKHNRNYVR